MSQAVVADPSVPSLDYYLPIKTADYDPAIPTPQQALGYQIGEWHVRAHERVSYMQKLDALSDRITMQEYARSPGRLPLVMMTITSPENHKKIEAIRKAHVDHVITGDPEAKDAPIIVWMGYSVHGNEPAGVKALDLLFKMLEVEPITNPDFVYHGEIIGLIGNLSAFNQKKRYIQKDINRSWLPKHINFIKSADISSLSEY